MSSFPSFVFLDDSTLTRTFEDNLVRSEMDSGPDKIRRRQTIPMFHTSFRATIHVDDLREFRAWFNNVLRSGSGWFSMKDPFDGTNRRFRFLENVIEWEKQGQILVSRFTLEAYDEL